MKYVAGITLLVALWLGGAAQAAEPGTAVDSERFRPAATRSGGIFLEGTAIGQPWEVDGTMWVHGSGRPVVLTSDGATTDPVVSGRLGGWLQAGFNVGSRVRLSVGLPVTLYQAGVDPTSGQALATGGVGDLHLTPQVMILDPQRRWLGLALSAPISFPTGREDALLGESSPTVHPRVHVSKFLDFGERHRWLRFDVGLQAGYRVRPRTQLLDLDTAGEVTFAVGGRWQPSDSFRVGTELVAALGTGANARSAEWVSWAGVTPDRARRFDVVGGLAVGLGRGVGTPEARIFAGLRVRLDPRRRAAVAEADAPVGTEAPAVAESGPEPPRPGESGPGWGLRLVGRVGRIDSSVLFQLDSARVTSDGKQLLSEVAGWLKRHPTSGPVEVGGHCDERGTATYNQELSQRRAEAVVDTLVGYGVPRERLTARGYGETRPVLRPGQASPEDVHTANRRVEFRFVGDSVASVGSGVGATPRRD